jgi:hypothetical protein
LFLILVEDFVELGFVRLLFYGVLLFFEAFGLELFLDADFHQFVFVQESLLFSFALESVVLLSFVLHPG